MFPSLPVRDARMPLAMRTLSWPDTSTELFSRLANKPWAMLLDSADAPHPDAQIDLIVADPIATLKVYENTCQFRYQAQTVDYDRSQCPFELMRTILNALYPETKVAPLPFAGGALGTFSYDLGRRIEKLPNIAEDDIGLPLACIGFYDWALVHDYRQGRWQLMHYLGEEALDATQQMLEALRKKPVDETSSFALLSPFTPQISKAEYDRSFDTVQAYLHSGDCYQINLTQRFSCNYRGSEWQAYRKLRNANKAPFSAFLRLEEGAVLSISPERFLKLTQRGIETKPIKGTQPRSANPDQDSVNVETLRHSAKDRAENLMIVDLLRNDIGRVASPGSVAVPKLFEIESFPAVHHMVSTVTGELAAGLSAFELLKAAFPGGSITGAPKIRAMEIIEELEPSRRSLYCGTIGYVSQHGTMDTNIAIRTLVAKDGKLYCWAGGGIVADSAVDAEYQETFDKVSRILPLLAQDLTSDH